MRLALRSALPYSDRIAIGAAMIYNASLAFVVAAVIGIVVAAEMNASPLLLGGGLAVATISVLIAGVSVPAPPPRQTGSRPGVAPDPLTGQPPRSSPGGGASLSLGSGGDARSTRARRPGAAPR